MKAKNLTHIHVHTEYSLLDGMGSPLERVLKAKELGMEAMACTDHNHLGGILDFQKVCKEHDIKPLLGVELYWTWDSNIISKPKEERDAIALDKAKKAGVVMPQKMTKAIAKTIASNYLYDTKSYHILLIAKNQTGWNNLVKLQSEASMCGQYNKFFHCDDKLLSKYSEGLICTTACIGSIIGSSIRKDDVETARKQLAKWKTIFGDNFFIEIQPLDWDEQIKVNATLIELSKEFNIPLIATNDIHYTNKEDHDYHDIILCIGTGKVKSDEKRMRYKNEYWVRSYDEMVEAFKRQNDSQEYEDIIKNALANTNVLADMVDDNIRLGSSVPLFTKTDVPKGYTNEKYLVLECWKRLYKYLAKHPKYNVREYEERLNWELYVINKKGYAPYMLTVKEFINWANTHGCPTGPGRGSAAGSLVLFLLKITKVIDPIQNGLLFSRFLTMDRTALPDVDVDLCYYGRNSVIKHLEEKYGKECVANIGTFTELGVKNGLKDIGRTLEIDFSTMNELTKEITEITDNDPSVTFKMLDALKDKDVDKYSRFKRLENEHEELFKIARRLEGSKRNFGVHASGVLVTPMPINDIFPTRYDKDTERIVTLYPGPQVEELNGVKYDLLGLKTVSIINIALKSIDEKLSWDDLYKTVEMDDNDVFSMICNRETEAVFQMESNLFKSIIKDMQPTHFNDLVVLTALGRPGPLQAGMHTKYNNRKNGLEEVVLPIRGVEDITGDTFGTIVYQEQIMAIAKKIAGFDDNQADSYLRKATAKQKKYLMDLCKRWLIYGKINEEIPVGYDNDNPNCTMYDPKGKYGAPIKGALCNNYSIKELEDFWTDIEGYCSYLFNKSHAACYSYLTLLTAYLKKYYPVEFFAAVLSVQEQSKVTSYTPILKGMNIEVKIPDINISNEDFTPIPEENTILFGLGAIKGVGKSALPQIMANRPYISIEDMLNKVPKKFLNKRVGKALIDSGACSSFNNNRIALMNEFYTLRKDKDEQLNPNAFNDSYCIEKEEKLLGASISYRPWWELVEKGEKIEITAMVKKLREHRDKNGNMMAFLTISSKECTIESIVFSKVYCTNSDKFDLSFGPVKLNIKGKKSDNGTLIINSVKKAA